MKQIPLLQGKALLVELPAGAKMQGLQTTSPNAIVYADTHGYGVILDLPPVNWRIIGMLSEVTEDDLTDVIDVLVSSESGKNLYPNLTGAPWKVSRIESLESAILAEGYYLDENPKRIIDHDSFYDGNGRLKDEEWYTIKCETEADAQERVLDRSRCLLLGRED